MMKEKKQKVAFLNPQNPLAVPPSASMANSLIDRLPDALLVTILSFLPTHIAARTSVLSRRFRHLWEASPSLALISRARDLRHPEVNLVAMANCALLRRNPSYPLLSLCLDVLYCGENPRAMVSSLLAKARSLDLRHLTLEGLDLSDFLPIAPIVFTINSLSCLSLKLRNTDHPNYGEELKFPSGVNLTSLKSFSLELRNTDLAFLNPLLSQLCSLEDLHLYIISTSGLSLSSKRIRKLKLVISTFSREHAIINLSLPSLESLHLEIKEKLKCVIINGEVPLLRNVVINLHEIYERDVSVVAAGMLNFISHVEELSLHLKESVDEKYPIPILMESGKDVPEFHKLEHLDLTLCFHEHNLQAVTTMLHNCPALKSLKLVHEVPEFTYSAKGRKRKDWGSKLPRNADGNYRYAYFKNLHLEENRKQVIKLLSKKCSSKRQFSKCSS